MCELAISVIERTADDPLVESKLVAKRGLVIDVLEDGHQYGRMELTNPLFRILKLPGVPLAFGRSFLGREIGDHPHALARAFRLDIDHPDIPADLAAYLADDARAEPSFEVDQATIAALKQARPTGDPAAIGDPLHVIG